MYYADDYYDEPSEFEQMIEEFKESLCKAVKEEHKSEMDRLRKRVAELSEVAQNFNTIKKDYEDKCQALELERSQLEMKVRATRLSELMQDFNVVMYKARPYNEKLPKCNKCDKNGYIHFTSPRGIDHTERCECQDGPLRYKPQEYLCASFNASRRNGTLNAWYKLDTDSDGDEYYEYQSKDLAEFIYKPGMSFESLNWYKTYFSTYEECMEYCNWLGNQKEKQQ